ncbi:MAG: class I SAM-dependent methyltransferase [Desulfamplus sp.]
MITVDFKRLKLKRGAKVLDIGCGEGRHTAKAWEFPEVFCIGADMSHKDLLVSQQKLKLHQEFLPALKLENGSEWALSAADITFLPFGDSSFDIIICSEVMEHIHEEAKALEELKRILKPGGQLVLTVPRYLPEKICWKLSNEYCNTEGGHIRIYKKKELVQKVIPLGFEFQGSHYAHSLHAPFWWLKCIIGLNYSSSNVGSKLVKLYHNMLVWDMMEKPFITGFMERILNPVIGKSVALYFVKRD